MNKVEKLNKQLSKLPDTPGVYFFVGAKNKLLYIGKATVLKSRVRSYFAPDIGEKRSEWIKKMVGEAVDIKFEKTDSVLEALILEAELIKKYLPPYNSIGKDQRSWNYVVITKEAFPRALIMREREVKGEVEKFGPFTHSSQLRIALKIIRKIFPFRDFCVPNQSKPCFNYQLHLCPGTCVGAIPKQEYAKTIRNIILFFKGKKRVLIKTLEREMKISAKNREFEKAAAIKSKIFALQHIHDIALIKKDRPELQESHREKTFRIEAYDIAHLSGTNMVGVMTVVEDEEAKKSDYRMFKIKGQKSADDTKALKEVLERRLKHTEWSLPDLVVVDGGVSQLNAAQSVLTTQKLNIPVVAVTKDDRHKAKEIQTLNSANQKLITQYKREILIANSKSHRFAITFHRKIRSRLPK